MAYMNREVECGTCHEKFSTIEVYNLKAPQPEPRVIHGTVTHGGEQHLGCKLVDATGKSWRYADIFHALGDHVAVFEFPEPVPA